MIGTTLVTGAFGQVGTRCAEILLSRGHTVIAVDLPNDNAAEALARQAHPGALVTEYTDLTDAGAAAAVMHRHRPRRSCTWPRSCRRRRIAIRDWPAKSTSRAPATW